MGQWKSPLVGNERKGGGGGGDLGREIVFLFSSVSFSFFPERGPVLDEGPK